MTSLLAYAGFRNPLAAPLAALTTAAAPFVVSAAKPYIASAIQALIPVVTNTAMYAGSAGVVVVGYKAACAIYNSESEVLEDFLWFTAKLDLGSAMDLNESIKNVATLAVFGASFIPLAYTAYTTLM